MFLRPTRRFNVLTLISTHPRNLNATRGIFGEKLTKIQKLSPKGA